MNVFRFKKYRSSKQNRVFQPIQPLEPRQFLSVTPALNLIPDASSSTVTGYTPAQIQAAYGFNDLSYNSGKTAANGAGQTIAIVDAYNDPNIAGDLKTFDSKFGLATASLKVVNQTGGSSLPASNGGWAEEISLDVEWVHSIAPGANILLVETNSSSNSDLMAGVSYARDASGVSVVSMSWGGSEFSGETSYDSDFTTPTGHTGVTFIAASGDDGSAYGVDWPASSPDVLSVGGTSLTTTSTGAYSSETGWSDSGGGVSQFEGEPEYQNNVQSEYARTVPDVSADASPGTGVAVYDSYSYDGVSGWVEFGGTSAAAPQWAGLIAIADQGRVLNKLGTLDGATNTLPTLYSLESSSSSYSSDFHDITSGATSYSIRAGVGYDLVTGIGSAKANNLVPALVKSTLDTKLTITTQTYYFPPPPPFFGWYFVATSHGTFAPEYLLGDTAVYAVQLTNTGSAMSDQALFDSNIPQSATYVASASDGPGAAAFTTTTAAAVTFDGSSAPTVPTATPPQLPAVMLGRRWQPSPAAMQTLDQDLAAIRTYAQQAVAQLARDLAIDLSHLETGAADAGIAVAESLIYAVDNNSWRPAAAIAAVAIAASLIGQDKKKQSDISPFSQQRITG